MGLKTGKQTERQRKGGIRSGRRTREGRERKSTREIKNDIKKIKYNDEKYSCVRILFNETTKGQRISLE